jgi:hypothetical protein
MLEFPLTMMVFLILLTFPALDLLFLAVAYNTGALLNDLQVRQAALIPFSDAQSATGPVRRRIPNQWANSGLGRFIKVNGAIDTEVSYRNGLTDSNGLVEKIVKVTTNFEVNPFLAIPIPMHIPGLNAPVTVRFSGERNMEDPTDAPQV